MACPGTQEDEQEHHPSLLTVYYYVPDTVLYSGLVISPCTGIVLLDGFQMVYREREEILHTEEEVDGCWLPTGLFIIAKESLLLWGTPPEVNEKLANIEKEMTGVMEVPQEKRKD